MENEDYIIIWEPKQLEKPEFRLYYDDAGKLLFYTCEKPEGNYIVIDAQTFAEGRPDVRVIDGKITQASSIAIVSKLMPSDEGFSCAEEDVSILVDETYTGEVKKWKAVTYELR